MHKFVFLSVLLVSSLAIANQSPLQKLSKDLLLNVQTRDEQGLLELITQEANGDKRTFKLEVKRLQSKGLNAFRAVVLEPKNQAGTVILSRIEGGEDSRWIYLPGSKQTRKISQSSTSNQAILDSEFTTDDFNLTVIQGTKNELTQDGQRQVLNSQITDKDSPYSVVKTWFNAKPLVDESKSFDKKGRLLRELTVVKYLHFSKAKKYRPSEVRVKNLQNKRVTSVLLTQWRINVGLKETDFNPQRLDQ